MTVPMLAVIVGILLFPLACRRVHCRRYRSRFWWTLNRVRAAVAYENDPGHWRQT